MKTAFAWAVVISELTFAPFAFPGTCHAEESRGGSKLIAADFHALRQCCATLGEELPRLRRWAKTKEDQQLVRQCEALVQRGGSLRLAGAGAQIASLKREAAAKLARARLVLKCDLHNVTVGERSRPDHDILSSSLYGPAAGQLVAAYRECVYKSDAVVESSRTVYMVSCDEGLTWQPYRQPGDGQRKSPRTDQRGPGGTVSSLNQAAVLPPDGKTRIEAFSYGWENHPESDRAQLEAKGFYIFDHKEGNVPGVLSIDYRVGMRRSRDGGATWETKEIKLPCFLPDLRPHMRGIALRDGTYLYPMYGRYNVKKEKLVSSLVLRTTDGGDHWQIHTIAKATAVNFDETSLVEAANGDVVAVIRTDPNQTMLWQAISKDGGKTWSEARESGMRGSVPFCVRTSDGCLVCIYGRREKRIFPNGTGMYAGVSKDHGHTWQNLCLEDCGSQFVDSYAQAVALPNGKVFTVYTAFRNGRSSSCGTLFTPSRAVD